MGSRKTAMKYQELDESIEDADIFLQSRGSPSLAKHDIDLSSSNTSQTSSRFSSSRLGLVGDDFLPVDMLPEDESFASQSFCSLGGYGHEPTTEEEQAQRDIFENARLFINPGPVLKYAIYLFGERKLFTLFCVHFMCSMVVFVHFFLLKFDQKAAGVPAEAPHYWWKRIVPPLEFGTMHAVLFQMALVPLTMSRYSIASLSDSAICKFVPLNRIIRMHIHLGYTICGLLVLSTILFFIFFGTLCSDGDQAICAKFTSEIMCTGYGIIAAVLSLLGTSYFRDWIPYEIFYGVHHIVFIFYALSIAHTLDDKHRSHEQERSQTFKWFSATLCFYLCDRLAMHFSRRYTARLLSSSTIEGSNGTRTIILRLRRPAIFSFKPGQYAFLRLNEIDMHWHPFSIASGPASPYLEFYIEVFKKDSWTDKLWNTLEGDGEGGFSKKQIDIEVMGPCGTPLAKLEDFSHCLAVGTGSGIVPILSLYKQHVRQLLRLDPCSHFSDLENHTRKIEAAERALGPRQGSLGKKLATSCVPRLHRDNMADEATNAAAGPDDSLALSIRDKIEKHERLMRWRDIKGSIKDMKSEAFRATHSIYGLALLALLPACGAMLIGLTISFNTSTVNLRVTMTNVLQQITVLFQLLFFVIALFVWDGNQLGAYTDAAICAISPFASWYFSIQYHVNGRMSLGDVTTYCFLIGYATIRLWSCTVKSHHGSWRKRVETEGIDALEKLELCWVSRSASLVSDVIPDINEIWTQLAEQWGEENAFKVCQVSVYVTDKDKAACELLKQELSASLLFRNGAIKFGRPDFGRLIEGHTVRMICTRKKSYSLLAFCGSPVVADEVLHHKVSNDIITAVIGHSADHQMEFSQECYGGPKKQKSKVITNFHKEQISPTKTLSTRTTVLYGAGRKYLV